MMDEILRAYDDGDITRNELFAEVLMRIADIAPEVIREGLRTEAGRLEAFEDWVDDVAAGAAVFSGSRQVRISDDARAAIGRFRDATRAARYAKLASRIMQWMAEAHDGEPVCAPDDLNPFQSTAIERMLAEVA